MQLESEIHKLSSQRLRAVFVARGDTSITHLYAHFPAMASLLPQLHLVSLLNGAEARFCEALGLQRVQVIGLMVKLSTNTVNCRMELLVRRSCFNSSKKKCPKYVSLGVLMANLLLSVPR